MSARNLCILLLENEESDVFLFRRALAHVGYAGEVRVVVSVGEARQYLEALGPFRDRHYYPIPDLIVSDMSLPSATGNAFLEWMRSDTRFAHIPFVFLSGSYLPVDKARAQELGVDAFFSKSGDFAEIKTRVAHILQFLPAKPPGPPPGAEQ